MKNLNTLFVGILIMAVSTPAFAEHEWSRNSRIRDLSDREIMEIADKKPKKEEKKEEETHALKNGGKAAIGTVGTIAGGYWTASVFKASKATKEIEDQIGAATNELAAHDEKIRLKKAEREVYLLKKKRPDVRHLAKLEGEHEALLRERNGILNKILNAKFGRGLLNWSKGAGAGVLALVTVANAYTAYDGLSGLANDAKISLKRAKKNQEESPYSDPDSLMGLEAGIIPDAAVVQERGDEKKREFINREIRDLQHHVDQRIGELGVQGDAR